MKRYAKLYRRSLRRFALAPIVMAPLGYELRHRLQGWHHRGTGGQSVGGVEGFLFLDGSQFTFLTGEAFTFLG